MTSIGTLYSFQGHFLGNKARITAAIAGLNLELKETKAYVDTQTPEFLAKFSTGKIPAFEGSDGFLLFESSAIAKYVASLAPNSGLLGKDAHEAALVDAWISYVDTEIEALRKVHAGLLAHRVPYTKPLDNSLRERLDRVLVSLNDYLHKTTFLVGHRITVADIALACILGKIFEGVYGAAERAKVPNVVRHFETIFKHPAVKGIVEVKYVEKALQYVPPPKEKKESKPAQVVAAVKEKIAPKPKAKEEPEEDEDEDADVKEEPKPKNPLDLLPKSTLNLEDWKRAYSNLETRGPGGSLEWFYSKYDPEGYSLWKVAFKYPEELTIVFMSSNLIGGFFNRLEASRKYAFGSLGVLGTSNNSLIEGVFIVRGPEIAPVVEVAPDWESYSYERIDINKPEQKAYFEAALAWDLEVNGKKWADGKNFK